MAAVEIITELSSSSPKELKKEKKTECRSCHSALMQLVLQLMVCYRTSQNTQPEATEDNLNRVTDGERVIVHAFVQDF